MKNNLTAILENAENNAIILRLANHFHSETDVTGKTTNKREKLKSKDFSDSLNYTLYRQSFLRAMMSDNFDDKLQQINNAVKVLKDEMTESNKSIFPFMEKSFLLSYESIGSTLKTDYKSKTIHIEDKAVSNLISFFEDYIYMIWSGNEIVHYKNAKASDALAKANEKIDNTLKKREAKAQKAIDETIASEVKTENKPKTKKTDSKTESSK